MKSRLPAIALVVAAVAGVGQWMRSGGDASLVSRLSRWYDARHGFGDACTDRTPSTHRGSYGIELDLPRCWVVHRSDSEGVPTGTVTDPGLGQQFLIRYIRQEDGDVWERAKAAVERRTQNPYANLATLRDFKLVSTSAQHPGAGAPERYFEWAAYNDRYVVLGAYEVHKFYAELPEATAFVQDIDRAFHTVRMEGSVTGQQAEGQR
jgi:hypothetical protein